MQVFVGIHESDRSNNQGEHTTVALNSGLPSTVAGKTS